MAASSSAQMEELSVDAMRMVLGHVPATTLVDAGQYVCKSWRALIRGDPSFANEHLIISSRSNLNGGFLLHHMEIALQKHGALRCAPHPPSSIFTYMSVEELAYTGEEKRQHYPIAIHRGRLVIPLSCNGLLLVVPGLDSPAYICNPLLGERTMLPPSSDGFFVYIGFAFDASSKKHKVFRKGVNLTHLDGFRWVFEVCSMDITRGLTSGWRRVGTEVEVRPFQNVSTRKGLMFDGKLHWTTRACKDRRALLLSIDVRSEAIASTPCPAGLHHVRFPFVFRGCLALYGTDADNKNAGGEIWVMTEFGKVESWIKEDSVGPIVPCSWWGITQFGECEDHPEGLLCSVVDGQIVCSKDAESSSEGPFHHHDLRTGRNRHVKLPPIDGHHVVEVLEYTPSLLSLPQKFEVAGGLEMGKNEDNLFQSHDRI